MGLIGFAGWLASGMMMAGLSTPGDVVESTGSFESKGRPIAVERFEPAAPGRHPAVLILHGAGGLDVGGPEFREFSRELARRGYVAQVVHYFDATGIRRADIQAIGRSYASWMLAVGDAVASVSAQGNVDPGRVGLLGFSLGSYLSLSVASQDRRVAAVVEYFGGLPDVFAWNLKRFPPTLILHGDADDVVPVAEALKLEAKLKAGNHPFESRIYPGQGHRFTGPDAEDAYRRALAFFDKHVKDARPGG